MIRKIPAVLAAMVLATAGAAFAQTDQPLVILHTTQGDVVLRLDARHAPITTCNFLRYVQQGRYAGGSFFRTVVSETNDNPNPIDVIQAATTAGSDDPGLGPITLERTIDTGLRHSMGTISMARDGPDTATSSFFIVIRDAPALDFGGGRNPDGQGFAAFGSVLSGMEILQAIHAGPAREEQLIAPVVIDAATLASPLPAVCLP
ncbi:peptidylprolyl isomerase [Brevundimonas subvibrioides]|uniref:peptidylprolyl isomerase n=1 Tax=Brevundimonas subvibrioides TaxID=74313 RepID=UPI0022B4B0C3|nr:peptidylprolyl isomerase [Brevundimonas subvibrioides]